MMLQMMEALDVVNSNIASDDTMQQTAGEPDASSLLQTAETVHQACDNVQLSTLPQNPQSTEHTVSQHLDPDSVEHSPTVSSVASSSECVDESMSVTVDDGETMASSQQSSLQSAKVPRNKHTVTRQLSDPKYQTNTGTTPELKRVIGLCRNVASKSPRTAETGTSDKKVSNATSKQTSRRLLDFTNSRSSAPSSSVKPVNANTRRPSVPAQRTVVKQSSGGSVDSPRKSGTVSTSRRALLRDHKITLDSNLAAGDCTSDVSLCSSTPVTSFVGDSNDQISVSRVSSTSDASSLAANHSSSAALSASVFQSPKPSTGKPHCVTVNLS